MIKFKDLLKESLNGRKFYYIILDKKNKTAQVVVSDDCPAVTDKAVRKMYSDYAMVWNGQNTDFSNLPKKYGKFKKISGLLKIDSKPFRLAPEDDDE